MNHFDDNQLDVILAQGPSDEDHAHLSACPECATRLEATRAELGSLKSLDESLAALPERFWDEQRRAILNRATEPPRKLFGIAGYAWSALAATLVVAAALLFSNPSPAPNEIHPQKIDDAVLLQSVEQSLQQYPEAYHPAQLMYSEIDTASNQSKSSLRKQRGKQ
jgi:anti-sigma factor RsiW